MLILSCRKQDKICIGQDIVLTIADLKGGKVRLGIEAPADLKIKRTAGDEDVIFPLHQSSFRGSDHSED